MINIVKHHYSTQQVKALLPFIDDSLFLLLPIPCNKQNAYDNYAVVYKEDPRYNIFTCDALMNDLFFASIKQQLKEEDEFNIRKEEAHTNKKSNKRSSKK